MHHELSLGGNGPLNDYDVIGSLVPYLRKGEPCRSVLHLCNTEHYMEPFFIILQLCVSFDYLVTAETLIFPLHYSAFATRTPRYLTVLSSTADRRWFFITTIPIVFLNEFAGVTIRLKLIRKDSCRILSMQ